MTSLPAEIVAEIDAGVRLGFETTYDLMSRIEARFPDEDVLLVVTDAVSDRVIALMSEQETWSRPTDAERLVAAFDKLAGQGILARHYMGPTRGEAEAALLGEAKGPIQGYVFYTPEDARTLLEGTLALSWGVSVDAEDGAADELAARMISALAETGLNVRWNGELDAPIQIQGIDWKHPRDAKTMDSVIATRLNPLPPQVTTADGKWWFRITLVASPMDPGALATLVHIRERCAPEARGHEKLGDFDPDADYMFEFSPIDLNLDGRGVQFTLLAPPSRPWEAQTDAIGVADTLVLVPSSGFSFAEMIARTHIMRGGEPPPIVIALDRWPAESVAEVEAERPADLAVAVDLESGDGVLDLLRAVVAPLVGELRKKLAS